MGYYTTLKCKFKLKKDTPDSVLNLLKKVLIDIDLDCEDLLVKHEFFQCERWKNLFLSTNGSDIQGGKLYKENDYWTVDLHTEFKDYDNEIDKFIDWINPYIVGRKKKQYIGKWKDENMNNYINIYIERENDNLKYLDKK